MRLQKTTISNVLVLVFIVFVLLSNLVPLPAIIGNALIAACGCIGYFYIAYEEKTDRAIWKITLFATILSLCMVISSFYNHNADLKEVLWIWCYMGAALLLCHSKIDDRWVQLIYYLLSAYFCICIVLHRSVHYILYYTSRNGISFQMLFCMLMIYLCRDRNKRVIYLPAVLNLIISVWALGRAGVLVSVLFLIGISIYGIGKDSWKKAWKYLFGAFFILIVSIFLLMTVFPTNETILKDNKEVQIQTLDEVSVNQTSDNVPVTTMNETFVSRFSSYGFRSIRISIWGEYLTGMLLSVPNFLMGVDCSQGELLSYYQQPHNSYLELHAKFGMAGVVIVGGLLLLTFIKLLKAKNVLCILVLIACGIRAMLDWAAFPGSLDVFFWFLCFQNVFQIKVEADE